MPFTPDAEAAEQSLQFMAQSMLANTRGRQKHDARIYWRRPMIDPDTKQRDAAPGWIIWASSDTRSTSFTDSMMLLGRTPLPQYGNVEPEPYGPWGNILKHPKGPAEFPVDQILAFGWYDPEKCPVPGVRFPQLKGQTITVYDCPECNNVQYAKPVWLARHLRNSHDYDRQEIQALGEELGISFEKERARGGRVEYTYDYDAEEFQKEIERAAVFEEPPADVQRVRPAGRRAPRKDKAYWTPERRAEASRKARERLAARAAAAQ